MKQCILHIGMPKTGSSSIQASLHNGLAEPSFRYFSFGAVNGSGGMTTLFGASPESYHIYRKLGWSAQQIEQHRKKLHRQLEDTLADTGDATLILSAESCWRMSSAEFEHLHRFMATRGYTVTVIAYIRPWQQWIESNFQERIKLGLHTFQVITPNYAVVLDYRTRIQKLEAIWGAHQVKIFSYAPSHFPEGCVVRDFCQHLGIDIDPGRICRSNDSLKLPALQLLYAYYKFGPGYGTGTQALTENHFLIRRLSQLRGPSLRLHPALIDPCVQAFRQQRPWLEQRLDSAFTEESNNDENDASICTEADLFDFSPDAVAWLAAATRNSPVRPARGQQAALAISAQMHQLRRITARHARFVRLLGMGKRKLLQLKQLVRGFRPAFQVSSRVGQAQHERSRR